MPALVAVLSFLQIQKHFLDVLGTDNIKSMNYLLLMLFYVAFYYIPFHILKHTLNYGKNTLFDFEFLVFFFLRSLPFLRSHGESLYLPLNFAVKLQNQFCLKPL